MVADVFFITIPLPWIVIRIMLVAVMIRFYAMASGDTSKGTARMQGLKPGKDINLSLCYSFGVNIS